MLAPCFFVYYYYKRRSATAYPGATHKGRDASPLCYYFFKFKDPISGSLGSLGASEPSEPSEWQ
jgi:hypothetical protein